MPYTDNNGVRIHYHIEGDGPPLVLMHGWTGSLEYWRDCGYVDELKSDYQLILVDARGHGGSDIPNATEAYDTKLMAEDVVKVLDDLNIEKAHFFGYSMGGWIGFELGGYAPDRFPSMIVGGAHPYAESLAPLREFIGLGTSAIADAWEAFEAPLSPETKTQLLEHDPHPLQTTVALDRPDISNVLSAMTMPCLVYVGEADERYAGAKECVDQLANGTFVSLPELDHLVAWVRSDLVSPYVKKFLADIR